MEEKTARQFRIDRKVVKDKEDDATERANELFEDLKDDVEIAILNAKDSVYSDIIDIIAHGKHDGLTDGEILENVIDFCISATQEYLYDDWLATGEAVEVEDGTLASLADGYCSIITTKESDHEPVQQ